MLFKYAILVMSVFALSLMIISANAQTAAEDRQAAAADQRALDDSYGQLEKDRVAGNAAGVEVDEDNVFAEQQDFRTDEKRTVEDDLAATTSDQKNLENFSAQLQQDLKDNFEAAETDKKNIATMQDKLQVDKRQMVADDMLEVSKDQLAFDSENRQLKQDLLDSGSIAGNVHTVEGDEEDVKESALVLQDAQLKLEADKGN